MSIVVDQSPKRVTVLRPHGYWQKGDVLLVADHNTPVGALGSGKAIFGGARLDTLTNAGIVGPYEEPVVEVAVEPETEQSKESSEVSPKPKRRRRKGQSDSKSDDESA